MNDEQISDKIDEAVQKRVEHLEKMSPETKLEFLKMDNKFQTIEKDICQIKENLKQIPTRDEMKLANRELLEEVIKEGDNKYASKQVERNVNRAVWVVVIAVITGVLSLVIIKNPFS
jgi:predicted nuclease with TOPRIM domain